MSITTVIFVGLLSVLDVTFTHFLFFLEKKKGVFDIKSERNWLPRLIMRGNPTPRNYLLGCLFSTGLFIAGSIVIDNFAFIAIGMLALLNRIHIDTVRIFYMNWDNEIYWKILRVTMKHRKRN